jgi:tRNA(fMet)-specific endonuclease VapC
MSLYVLDTNHVSLYQRGHVNVTAYVRQTPRQRIAITVVTAEEMARGRLVRLNAAKNEAGRIEAYQWWRETLGLISAFRLLDYDIVASAVYESLRQQKLRIGTQDLRIAAITLALDATLITRNQRDFGQVPNLKLIDWTK